MKNLGKVAIALAAVLLLATSCWHRSLFVPDLNVKVVFDWTEQQQPRSMVVYFIPKPGSTGMKNRQTYSFSVTEEKNGTFRIVEGLYDILCFNTETENLRSTPYEDAKFEGFTITTDAAKLFSGNRVSMRAGAGSDEEMRKIPDEVLCDCCSNVYILEKDDIDNIVPGEGTLLEIDTVENVQIVKLKPRLAVERVKVVVNNLERTNYIAEVNGVLSGMARGVSIINENWMPNNDVVSIPFDMTVNSAEKQLTAEFYTFGHCPPVSQNDHLFSLYVVMKDGSKLGFPKDADDNVSYYNVTDQVHSAGNVITVTIDGSDINLPAASISGGGFQPNLQDWEEDEFIDIGLGSL